VFVHNAGAQVVFAALRIDTDKKLPFWHKGFGALPALDHATLV
jgi:hypothetical protein